MDGGAWLIRVCCWCGRTCSGSLLIVDFRSIVSCPETTDGDQLLYFTIWCNVMWNMVPEK